MLSARCPAPLDAAGILGDDPVATLFRPGKVGRVQKQIFETGSQTQLALIKHGQNTDEQKRFPSPAVARHPLEPRSSGRESAPSCPKQCQSRLTSAAAVQGFKIRVQPKFHPQLNYFCFVVAPPKSNRKLFITTMTVLPS
jgi:hypothetical protein